MLNLTVFLPLLAGLLALTIPTSRPGVIRIVALVGSLLTLLLTLALAVQFSASAGGVQFVTDLAWIPGLGARYHVGLDGLGLALSVLTALLLTLCMVYVLPNRDRPREHAFLFLLMATGLLGLFTSQDLLLFYVFFEVALVPMYFIVGIWGGDKRRYAALKFFLYTRAGSLAMLLSILALYLGSASSPGTPHTFDLAAIAAAHPFAGSPIAFWVLLGLLVGFGVKLPTVPLHNWLPDAHVEAPTEGSVMLAGAQLKMGAFGLLHVLLPTLPEAVRAYAWLPTTLGLISLIYGALAALAQRDLKRLVAYTSINHMGYVMLAVGVWGLAGNPAVRTLALSGAAFQMISHGLLTGGMFFLVGSLQHRPGTRQIAAFGGLLARLPIAGGLLVLLSFGSLGLPGLSGFVAEFQVIASAVGVSGLIAFLTVLGLLIATGLYLWMLSRVAMGRVPDGAGAWRDLSSRERWCVTPLAALSVLIGVLPGPLVTVLESSFRSLGR